MVRPATVPWTAYVVCVGVLVFGIATSAFGFYNLLPRTTLAGFFWIGVGLTGAYYIVRHRRMAS
jgi:hypothetical protein